MPGDAEQKYTLTLSDTDLTSLLADLPETQATASLRQRLEALRAPRHLPVLAERFPSAIDVPDLTQNQAEQVLLTARRSEDRAMALLALSVSGGDPQDIQTMLLAHFNDPDPRVRAVAALGISHLARLTGQVDAKRVLPALRRLARENAQYASGMQEVIDGITSSTAQPKPSRPASSPDARR